MLAKVILVLFALTFQHIESISRADIQSQFQPTLVRLRNLANVKYLETGRDYNALFTQLNKHQLRSKNSTQTQINNIRNVISEAKKSPNVTATALVCLKNQENVANRLSTVSLNNCLSNANITALKVSREKFNSLASVASSTVSYCQNLNPLETQLESYAKCLADKIPDLNRQINIVEREYQKLSNATLHYNIRCLTDNGGSILGQIGVISYEINVCFFAPL